MLTLRLKMKLFKERIFTHTCIQEENLHLLSPQSKGGIQEQWT